MDWQTLCGQTASLLQPMVPLHFGMLVASASGPNREDTLSDTLTHRGPDAQGISGPSVFAGKGRLGGGCEDDSTGASAASESP